MTYKSKRTIASIFASILLFAGYFFFVMLKFSGELFNPQSWAVSTLIFIGIAIAIQIAIQIMFHIALSIGIAIKEREQNGDKIERILNASAYEDEMDKLINLKSMRVYSFCVAAGFLLTLGALALGTSVLMALNILFAFFFGSGLAESAVRIYFYERGVSGA